MARAVPPTTHTPVYMTRSRKVRSQNSFDPDDQSVHAAARAAKLPDPLLEDTPFEADANDTDNAVPRASAPPVVIPPADSVETAPETLDPEEPDTADTVLQANGAYQALRQADEALTPVGTI